MKKNNGSVLIVVDFEEFKPETYKGVYLFDSGKELFRSSIGNFKEDYNVVFDYVNNNPDFAGKLIMDSSSVDNWYMDSESVRQ